ncbi:UPF0175 family protein [Candidatus Woesearchaeota archaeon]|nr:UPF0175 family protein [Candidatus Woesearchaeota archaeon]
MDEVRFIMEDMTELQKSIVLLLSSRNNEPIKGNTWFQKEIFLIAQNSEDIEEEASFESDMYGPWSETVKEQLEELEQDEIVQKSGNKMWLSGLGVKLADKLRKMTPKERLEMIEEFKGLLNDLSDTEVLTFIYYTFPEFTEESLVRNNIEKNRLPTAIKLYAKGKISLQRAAEIAGKSLEEFTKVVRK